ncbi:MAG: hypothetical protein EHM91_12765 [Planctomycetota bacterium]|nr:MAG: hypothetical protein EHM91_12765 [Planctomycetota bacterium]
MTTPEELREYLREVLEEWGPRGFWDSRRRVRLLDHDDDNYFFEVEELETGKRYGFDVDIVVRQIFPTGSAEEAS